MTFIASIDNSIQIMDRVSRSIRSQVMSSVRSTGTRLEDQLADILQRICRIKFERNPTDIEGRPDFVARRRKIAIFVDSCFWHGCRWHCRMPASNRSYWTSKIARNRARDKIVNVVLRRAGWTVIRIWEHALKDESQLAKVITKIKLAL
jgi:DNA mismatch endonuclease (patch repair protein)